MENNNQLLTTNEAAGYLRLKTNTLAIYRMSGHGPKYIKQSARRILYRKSDLEDGLNKRSFHSTAAATVSGM